MLEALRAHHGALPPAGGRAKTGVAATIRPRRGADARYRTTLYLLLAPFLLGVVVLVVVPMALSIGLAFTTYDGLSAPEWRGLANFRELATDPLFHIALRNSLVFVALTVPLRVLIALGLALLLNRSRRGVGLYRVAVYVPTIVPSVAYALIWLWIFNPRYGPLNQTLESLGLPAPASTAGARPARAPAARRDQLAASHGGRGGDDAARAAAPGPDAARILAGGRRRAGGRFAGALGGVMKGARSSASSWQPSPWGRPRARRSRRPNGSRSWSSAISPRRPPTSSSWPSSRVTTRAFMSLLIHIPSQGDYRKRLGVDFAAGNPADIVLLNYRRYGAFAAKGVLEPLGPYLERSRVIRERDFYPQALAPFRWRGEQMCMPLNLSSLIVYYNRGLFDRAGVLRPTDDWTWDDFLEAARALTRDTNGAARIDQYGLGTDASLFRGRRLSGRTAATPRCRRHPPVTLDALPTREALQWFVDLQVTHHVVPERSPARARPRQSWPRRRPARPGTG